MKNFTMFVPISRTKENSRGFLVTFVFDTLTFAIIVVLISFFYERILDELIALVGILGQTGTDQIPATSKAAFAAAYRDLIRFSMHLFFSLFFSYVLLQGSAWYFAHRMFKKFDFVPFIWRFFQVTSIWTIVVVLYLLGAMRSIYANAITLGSFIDPQLLYFIVGAVGLVLVYLIARSSVLVQKKTAFRAVKNSFLVTKQRFTDFGLILSGFVVGIILLVQTARAGMVALSVVLGVLLLAAVSFARIMVIKRN